MSAADSLADLKHDLALKSGIGLRKCRPSRRDQGESRAASAFAYALKVCGLSQRAAARWLCCDERMVRDWIAGSRALPAWAAVALPRDGQIAFLRACAEEVPAVDESDEEERVA